MLPQQVPGERLGAAGVAGHDTGADPIGEVSKATYISAHRPMGEAEPEDVGSGVNGSGGHARAPSVAGC